MQQAKRKLDAQKLNVSSFRGLCSPDSLTRGSAHGPLSGLCPQTPAIGSSYRARHTPQLCRLLNPTSPLVPKWLPTQVCSQMASGLVEPLLLGSRVCSTNRKTDTQTTDRITSVAVGRIYLMHAIWPTTGYLEQKCLRPEALPVIDQCKITFRPSSLN